MPEKSYFTLDEKENVLSVYRQLLRNSRPVLRVEDFNRMRRLISEAVETGHYQRNKQGINPVVRNLNTALILCDRVGLERSMLISVLLFNLVVSEFLTIETVKKEFGDDIAQLIRGLIKSNSLYAKQAAVESENFRKLLLSFAEDIRVIIIMIADRLCVMKMINHHPNEKYRYDIACEASYLYAPLAHRLGLYSIKSELEDLSLKYTNREIYDQIAHKLNETKRNRDKYIMEFIQPVKQKLEAEGLHFEIKGRTKSIFSIWNKMKKQKADLEDIYDLFAIRVILETPLEQEKADCWKVYSIVTDMYQPNPKRMKDWLSIPKSNGYESLHITVLGPKQRWVEVQIRTRRMDEIAERGLAAHWRYKGIKGGESGVDEWLNNIRSALENNDDLQLMDQFKMDLYEDEVFVFTPKGDLFKFPKGATVLDFAYTIHTNVGDHCIGAKINEKNAPLRQKLNSGDQVEIMTSNTQTPKQDWLNIVTTSKARTKIRQALKEMVARQHAFAKETLERKFKNRKLEYDEATMMRLIKRLGFKNVTEFYQRIADGGLDVNEILDKYVEQQKRDSDTHDEIVYRSAEGYNLQAAQQEETTSKEDVLVIDQNLKGLEFKLAKCCNPIYGDDVFGFVTVSGGIKIHRADCPNANQMRERFGYRIVKARWAGKSVGTQYPITLRVVGHDDIGIVTNITSIISKENGITLRSIGIDSNDGLFSGTLTVMVGDTGRLEALIKKLRTIKGVKQVSRN